MDTNSANYIEKRLSDVSANFGKLVSDTHAEARLNVCLTRNAGKPCEYLGKVNPLPGLHFELGCQKCGCALQIKTKMLYLGIEQLNKKIKCPHELGNLWHVIDSQF